MSTATLVHTSSRAADNALRIARVAAASRVAAERVAREARETAQIARTTAAGAAWVAAQVEAGAVRFGFKICLAEGGKWRPVLDATDDVAGFMARCTLDGDEVEAWGITAAGEYLPEVG